MRKLFFTSMLFIALGALTSCSHESESAIENQNSSLSNLRTPVEFESIVEFDMKLSAEETSAILLPLINELPNSETSLLVVPNLETGVASAGYIPRDPEHSNLEPNFDPNQNTNADPSTQSIYVYHCNDGNLHLCDFVNNALLDGGCSVSGMQVGSNYVFIADCD